MQLFVVQSIAHFPWEVLNINDKEFPISTFRLMIKRNDSDKVTLGKLY